MPAKQCTICAHPRRQAAEALLAEGLSPRKAAKQLNISYPSLERHRTGCMVRALQQRPEAKVLKLDDPQAELGRIHSETLCILEVAKTSNDHELAFKAIAQARLNIQLSARMLGILEPPPAALTNTLTLQNITQILQVHRRAAA